MHVLIKKKLAVIFCAVFFVDFGDGEHVFMPVRDNLMFSQQFDIYGV